MRLIIGLAVICGLAAAAHGAAAESPAAVPQPAAGPQLQVDRAQLPPPPSFVAPAKRSKMLLLETGVGAVAGIVVVDVATGGLLLAPLGLPSFASLFGSAAAAAPVAAPAAGAAAVAAEPAGYTIAQRLLAGVGTMASALAGGYLAPLLVDPASLPQP